MTVSDHLANFPFFEIREESTMHPKGNSLDTEENLEERLLN